MIWMMLALIFVLFGLCAALVRFTDNVIATDGPSPGG